MNEDLEELRAILAVMAASGAAQVSVKTPDIEVTATFPIPAGSGVDPRREVEVEKPLSVPRVTFRVAPDVAR